VADPVDRALRDLDESWGEEEAKPRPAAEDNAVNDRTILGVGTPVPVVAAPSANPVAVADTYLQPRARRPTYDRPSELAHPERSPLAFVMRASESPGPQKHESHDMSMFVAGLVADTSPVVETPPAGTAMEPVMRSTRKRRQWIVASAIAGTAIVGVLVGMRFAASEDPPKIAASETVPEVAPQSPPEAIAETQPQPAAADPTASPTVDEVAPAPVEATDVAPSATPPPATPPVVVATAKPTAKPRAATKPATKTAKKAAPKKVATANTTAKKSTKKPSTTKSTIAKKATAKKATPAKKKARR
jgi:hypothetical protein